MVDDDSAARTATTAIAGPLSPSELDRIDAYWRAANYLSVGQIYLLDNPLLREPLRPEHVKPRLLGHWGTTPGLNFIYAHLNRVIRDARPGHDLRHRARATAGRRRSPTPSWRAPTASSTRASRGTRTGMRRLFRQFSFPGGIPSHVAPETPGSIHEGGELGYALSHAYGAAFDNPDLIVACVVGDGEAETGPLADELALEQVPQPGQRRRGAADPAPQRLQDRQPDGARPHPRRRSSTTLLARLRLRRRTSSTGDDPAAMHQQMAATLDAALERDPRDPAGARAQGGIDRAPALADDRAAHAEGLDRPEGGRRQAGRGHAGARTRCRSASVRSNPEHLRAARGLAAELPAGGALRRRRRAASRSSPSCRRGATAGWAPTRTPTAGSLLRDLRLPDFRDYAVDVPAPGATDSEATRVLGTFLRDVMDGNRASNFRVFGPDETASNRLRAPSSR